MQEKNLMNTIIILIKGEIYMIKNKKEKYTNTLCVNENLNNLNNEDAAIDRVIELYESGAFTKKDFISLEEFEKRIRGVIS